MVGERERRSAESEQRDDLLRLELGRQEENGFDSLLGHSSRLLVARDGDAPESTHVDREPVDVGRDNTWASEETMTADEARHGDLAERHAEVADEDDDAYVDPAEREVDAAFGLDSDARIAEDPALMPRLRCLAPGYERPETDRPIIARECPLAVAEL